MRERKAQMNARNRDGGSWVTVAPSTSTNAHLVLNRAVCRVKLGSLGQQRDARFALVIQALPRCRNKPAIQPLRFHSRESPEATLIPHAFAILSG